MNFECLFRSRGSIRSVTGVGSGFFENVFGTAPERFEEMSYRGYRRGRSASKYKRKYRTLKRARGYAAARRYPRARGYHPYGQMMRPYSSVPRDFKTFDTLGQSYTGRRNPFPFSSAGRFWALNTVINGASFWQRVGRQICMKSLELFYEIRTTGTNIIDTFRTCNRLLVVYDRQPNGAPPLISQILAEVGQTTTAGGTNTPFGILTANPWAEPNPVYKDRFVVLRSVKGILPPVGAGGATRFDQDRAGEDFVMLPADNGTHDQIGATGMMTGHLFIPLKNLMTTFIDSTGGIGDIATGALWLIVQNDDQVAGAASTWGLNFNCRLKYMDC